MKNSSVLIFGYNEYGVEIAKNVLHKYEDVRIFSLDDIALLAEKSIDFKIEKFDLSDNWDDLKNQFDMEKSIIFCALNDEAQNIFLTISLRSTFKNVNIIALANNNEDANKISMAGASKVIPLVETTAGIITDMLEKPIITKVLHSILYKDSNLKIEQIPVENEGYFGGKYPADIEWSRDHGVIVLSIMHEDMSSEFIYSTKTKHHVIKKGDIFVAVGYTEDLKAFKHLAGKNL
jgi:Trk K+ transport system NAD-binding subunit